MRLFVGSEEPLLLRQNRANKKARKNAKRGGGRTKKSLVMEKNEQRQIASSLPPSRSSSIAALDEGDANQNAALFEERGLDPDAGADVDKEVWPGEYGHANAYAYNELITVSGLMPITPEELERAIGAAFAADMQY